MVIFKLVICQNDKQSQAKNAQNDQNEDKENEKDKSPVLNHLPNLGI